MENIWPDIIHNYDEKNIFNADETDLFYKLTPNQTLKFKGEKCVGDKLSKVRITILVCAIMNGSGKHKLTVIGKSQKPRCFKNVKKLPVDYKSNKKAWMTSDLFQKYLRQWDKGLSKKKRKIVLLIDNCTAHIEPSNLQWIKVVFLPTNTTSVLDPMDQKSCWAYENTADEDDREEDDNLPLSKWLEKHGVNAFSQNEIEHFECCDDDIITSGEGSKEDIVALVNEKNNSIVDSSSDMEEEQDEPAPSNADAKAAANVLNNFFPTENIDEHVVDLFKIVDKKIDELYIKSKTFQPKTSFFNVVD
ncbi:Tigger transposable element-derived protein 6 [Araneus ventricosus]|uniref:Tigger transposable element-derived protein 6 n=1 Tax=Araneus ventricosus TaxID=182803 RepID=A0A4Y2MH55_ARAVE|nr:Tigger transposable element-derived protein 6 [Araneus ventricosus]